MTEQKPEAWGFPNKATPLGSSVYYSVRFSPPRLRPAMALLYAWQGEVRAVLAECSDPGVARLKLQWWREELERCYQEQAAHPLTQALAPVIKAHALPKEAFLAMTQAVEAQIQRRRPRDMEELNLRCGQDHGSLFKLAGHCHGIQDPAQLRQLSRLGAACSLVYLIRDLGASLRRDYHPLPAGLASSSQLSDEVQRDALRPLADQARSGLQDPPPGTPPGVAARAAILATLLKEIEGADFAVVNQRIGLTPLRKLWIGWRAGR